MAPENLITGLFFAVDLYSNYKQNIPERKIGICSTIFRLTNQQKRYLYRYI